MINRNDLKQKYASEFDRQKNYDKILDKCTKRHAPYRLAATFATLILVAFFVPKQISKSADNVIFDEYASEIGPEIVLNINQATYDMKNYDVSPSLRADMEMKYQVLGELEFFIEDICPEGFTASAPVQFAITSKESNSETSSYICIDFTKENKNIQLAYSKYNDPFRDYFLSQEEDVSILDGVEIKITQQLENHLYLCLFELNGYYFDIETSQITEAELIDFLLNLISKVKNQFN